MKISHLRKAFSARQISQRDHGSVIGKSNAPYVFITFRLDAMRETVRDPEISRWWKRRFDLFERFDEGIQLDRGMFLS